MVLYLAVGNREGRSGSIKERMRVWVFTDKNYIRAVNEGLEVFDLNMIIDAVEVRSHKACRGNKGDLGQKL